MKVIDQKSTLAPGCICTRYAFQNLKNMKILQKFLKKIGHKHMQVPNTRKKIRQKITIFLLCAKKKNFWPKNILFRSHFCLKFVFFAQSRKIVIFCQKNSRVFVTSVCLCPNFFKFFRTIFIFFKFRKAYRVHMHPGGKTPPSMFWTYQYSQP